MTVYTAANLDFNRGHDADFLAHLCKSADVLLVCEAKDVDLAALLPDGWVTTQDMSTVARAGSAVCVDGRLLRIIDHDLTLGSPAVEGEVLARHIAWAVLEHIVAPVERTKVFACHAPKKDTGMQAAFYASLGRAVMATTKPVVIGGDFNRNPLVVADMLGLRGDAAEVIGVLHSRSIRRVGLASVDEVPMARNWTDHPTLSADLIHKETVVTKGIYPAAKQLLIPPGANDPAITPRIAVLHVDAGNAESLHTFFRDRSGGIESHFHVQKDGGVEQYRNIFRQADANLDANDFAVSIETQGFGAGEWTAAQLAAIKKLLLWLNAEAGIPLIRCTRWDGRGIGYHVQFGAPGHWTPVAKSCPGPDRIKQYENVLIPWMKSLTAPPPPQPSPRFDVLWEQADEHAHTANAVCESYPAGTRRGDAARKIRANARENRSLAAEISNEH